MVQARQRDLANLDPPVAKNITDDVEEFARTGQGDVAKLHGTDQLRLRLGDWRVIYALIDDNRGIRIDRVAHRREVYRK